MAEEACTNQSLCHPGVVLGLPMKRVNRGECFGGPMLEGSGGILSDMLGRSELIDIGPMLQ